MTESLTEPRRRLHPLSPLLHSAKSLVIIIAAISWQGYAQLGLGPWAGLVTLLLIGSVVMSAVSWYMTGYHVVGRELRVYEGVLSRRTRAIPLERLQAVEVIRPLLARLTGLAELRLEVVGGGKTEAPLAYLTMRDARALRERLLGLSRRYAAPAVAVPGGPGPAGPAVGTGPAGTGPVGAGPIGTGPIGTGPVGAGPVDVAAPAPPEARHLHAVNNADVFVGQMLTPQVSSVPFALAFLIAQTVTEANLGFIAVASTLTAMAGIVLQPVRRVLDDWNFRLGRDAVGLRVRHGLVETRSQTVPIDRVQAIRATWPLLWRVKGWLRMRLDVAGYAGPEQQNRGPTDNLLPVGDLATARRLVPEVLPGVDLVGLPLIPPPARARWLAPLAQPRLGAGLTDQVFAARSGVLTRRLVLVPYARIQSVRVVQGPIQRRLGLATVYADTAAGVAAAEYREIGEAWRMAAELTDRARAARRE
jgi:putative membrane protein